VDGGAQRLAADRSPAGRQDAGDRSGHQCGAHAWFEETSSALEIEGRFSIETLRENPFDFSGAGEPLLTAPAAYPEPLGSILEPYLAQRPEPAAVGGFAQAAKRRPGRRCRF
jgi:hypothetical protein